MNKHRAQHKEAQGQCDTGPCSKKAADGVVNEKPESEGVSKCKAGPNEEVDVVCQAFIAKVPYNVLDEAIKEAIQSQGLIHSRNQEARAAGQQPYHQLSFRSRKAPRQTITIRK
ncbi:11575_t:CDS:2 [Ambispora gerdemannii]|uniref:11575_t:CDS:1 n=1 Tax=Ambispora gerdemannii TaxID=144530 RepID=A0A9N8ZX98_9GLOM|nr:11575_t:CDS:2 [Ambispora gerdemannii]